MYSMAVFMVQGESYVNVALKWKLSCFLLGLKSPKVEVGVVSVEWRDH